MFHVLKDEDRIVAILANVETEQVQDAIRKVDVVFCRLYDGDEGPLDMQQQMCEELGIPYDPITMAEWPDVLVALLVAGGATEVEYIWHECVPKPSSAGRTENT